MRGADIPREQFEAAEDHENDRLSLAQDAARYRRLRIVGCVPFAEEGFFRLQNLDNWIDADLRAHKSRVEYKPESKD